MFGNFILLIILLIITFCISPGLGILTLLILTIILPIAKYFRNLELKKQGRNIGRVEYYADKEYSKLSNQNNIINNNIFCSQCGNRLNQNDKFCSKCGRVL